MTSQEKLKKIEQILSEYIEDNSFFIPPERETDRQQKMREDLHTVVSLLFRDELEVKSEMTVAQIKAKMQEIWKKTKPDTWK